jgi:hypothetical protein
MSVETQATPPPAPAPAAPSAPATVTLTADQFQAYAALQSRLAALETEQKQRETAATEERVRLLTQKGEAENAVKLIREEKDKDLAAERAARSTLEDRAKRYALDGELSRVLASQPLVPGGADQLTRLWRSEFSVHPEGDSFMVRTPTHQSVGDFVAAQLARPEYAHFVRASNPAGGTGGVSPAGQAAPTAPANPAAAPQIKTLSDAVIFAMQERQKGGGDGRTNPAVGWGLRPAARQA